MHHTFKKSSVLVKLILAILEGLSRMSVDEMWCIGWIWTGVIYQGQRGFFESVQIFCKDFGQLCVKLVDKF